MRFEAYSVLDAATVAIERLIDRAELALRSALRPWRQSLFDGVFVNLPAQPAASRSTSQPHETVLADIVQAYCPSGTDIAAVHGAAAIKIDAAEYAFTMMLAELRDVMSTPPTAWQPSRTPYIEEMAPVSHLAARAA